MITTVQTLMSNSKRFGRKPKQTQGDLADQKLQVSYPLKREKFASQPQTKASLSREAKRWQSFQPWGRA